MNDMSSGKASTDQPVAVQPPDDGDEVLSGLPAGYESGNQSLAVSLARAEVDQQIATARAFPRSVTRVVQNILALATIDEETAEECVYALPRGGKPIKGPSIRLAEIVANQWGNCRMGARVVHVDKLEKYVEAEGVFHDLETNTATTARVRRRISDKRGRVFNEDMIVVTGNAAAAIAKRNAILGGVPRAVWRRAYGAVESVLAGDIKTLSERRTRAMKAFAAFGVTPEQIFASIGVTGADEITLDHISTLIGMHSALKSGESTVEEMFAKAQPAGNSERPKDLNSALDQLADQQTGEIIEPDQPGDAAAGESSGNGAGHHGADSPAAGGSPDQSEATAAKPARGKAGAKAQQPQQSADGSDAPTTPKPPSEPTTESAGESKPPVSSPAARLSDDDKAKLRGYAKRLGGAERQNKLQTLSAEFWMEDGGEIPDEETPVGGAVTAIFGWHLERIAGRLSPADVDNKVRELLK